MELGRALEVVQALNDEGAEYVVVGAVALLSGDFPVVRYGPPDGDFMIDLMSRLGEGFGFDDLESEVLTVEGVPVRLATPATLYAMKRDTVRGQDRVHAEALRVRFGLSGG